MIGRHPDSPPVPDAFDVAITASDGTTIHRVPEAAAERVRYLIARVQLNDPTGLPSRLAVTSALSGEGVTYVARTFAAVVAHDLGRRVCLVDLDWSSAAEGPGIGDVVAGAADLDDIIESTYWSGLALVGPGRVEPSARAALVRSADLDAVIDDLATRFDHLVLEFPPVLATADALTLMRTCDTYLFVVHQGVTTGNVARSALRQLDGAICLGAVLNRSSSRIPRWLAGLMSG